MKKSLISLLIVAAALIASALTYADMPDRLPIHWNAAGEIDRFTSKAFALFFLPGLMALLIAMFRVIPLLDAKKQNYEKFESSIRILENVVLLGLLVFHGITIGYGYGMEINVSMIVPPVIGIIFVALGNYMPRFQPNSHVGIKTASTLGNETVWRKTHQATAKFYVIGGLLMILTAFVPAPFQSVAFLCIIVGVALSTIFVSMRYTKKRF
ncbi:SdpI family protein [Paenibacillus arenilitoris]|uniref:DUF1648 domain-containing protein n=1 Tax=Paenibacillus arenilitoris TaxID=2772299 RepID=A0A927CKM3_9BACL|nr:DUF1648 domain-containing protein [Paenibacillus arenilitoris]MBD2869818.1 DUF1648 domain-containing protein [Paenibacillus arenilitoris]